METQDNLQILSPTAAVAFTDQWYEHATAAHFWMEWRVRVFLAQLHRLGIPSDLPWKGLDIGCGQGILINQLERRTSWIIDGAELNRPAIESACLTRGRRMVYDINDQHLSLKEHYDFLILFDIVEHLSSPSDFLISAAYHLKPGGHIFINVPALPALRSVYDDVLGHLRRYTKPMAALEATAAGLCTIDARYWGISMLPLLWLRKLTLKPDVTAEVVRKGFSPPSFWIHSALRGMMRIETSLWPHPPVGTSLMCVLEKPAAE